MAPDFRLGAILEQFVEPACGICLDESREVLQEGNVSVETLVGRKVENDDFVLLVAYVYRHLTMQVD